MPSFLPLLQQQVNLSLTHHLLFSLLPIIFVYFLIKWLFIAPTTSTKHLPPSPPKLPIIGNFHQLGLYPHHSLQSLAQQYGPLMLLHLGSVKALIVSSADAASEIMKTHDLIFANRPKSSLAKRLLYDYKDMSVAPYGEYWRQLKSICVLQLLSNRKVQSFRVVREEETALLVKKIKESSFLVVDLSEMLMLLTNDVICRVAFGRKYSGGKDGMKFKKLLRELVELLGSFNVGGYIPWLAWVDCLSGLDAKVDKVAREFDEFLEGVVEEHERKISHGYGCESVQGEEHEDFVDVLLRVPKENMAGPSFDRDSIKALILDIFAGGTDTTYTVLEWAMTHLLRQPRVMKCLQNEVREIAKGKSMIVEEDLDNMTYLKMVIKETLRLHPPIPLLVPREASQDVKVMGYDIAAGTTVITNAWAIGRDPKYWDEPEEFRPERFLNSSVDFKGHNFQLIPFGAGRRGCPGTSFAMATNELVLANLVHKFDWKLPNGAKGEDLDMTECTGLTIHRKSPLLAVATPYSSC